MKDNEEVVMVEETQAEESVVEKKPKAEKKHPITMTAPASKSNASVDGCLDKMRRELLKSCSRADLVDSCVDKGVVTATFATNNGHVTVIRDV